MSTLDLVTGEPLHAIYRSEFRHRWGGNVPSWQSLSDQERSMWADVERRALFECLVPFALGQPPYGHVWVVSKFGQCETLAVCRTAERAFGLAPEGFKVEAFPLDKVVQSV